jgi:aconitase A
LLSLSPLSQATCHPNSLTHTQHFTPIISLSRKQNQEKRDEEKKQKEKEEKRTMKGGEEGLARASPVVRLVTSCTITSPPELEMEPQTLPQDHEGIPKVDLPP